MESAAEPANVLIATWQGGGATQPAIGLGRLLADRGHQVRILGPAAIADRVFTAGCVHRPIPAGAEFDPRQGRAADTQLGYVTETFFGNLLPDALEAEITAAPADVVIVDFLLRSVACRAERLDVPHVLLVHLRHHFYSVVAGDGTETFGWRWQYEKVNATREKLGLAALPVGPQCLSDALAEKAARALVVMPEPFDPWPGEPPTNVVHVGAITEEPATPPWQSPWPADDDRPLMVVTMGTTYMGQEDVFGRIVAALGDVDARVLVLTGLELDPAELEFPPSVQVHNYVPHAAVFPQASVVVTHAGMGTVMAAFNAGVPIICMPLGRDQHDNALRAKELGCAEILAADASVAEIRQAVVAALASSDLREAALRMAAVVRTYGTGDLAVAQIEQVVAERGLR